MHLHFLSLLLVPLLFLLLPRGDGKKLFEQSCSSSSDCEVSLGLGCFGRKCRCDPGGASVYSLSQSRCVGAAGRECLKGPSNATFCVDHSACKDYGYIHFCSCNEGFYAGQDGHCYSINKYGEACQEENFSCGDTLSTGVSCIDKKCRCLLGETHQFYEPKEARCTSYAGGQCIPNVFNGCTRNSVCGEVNELVQGASFLVGHKCLCSPGFSATRSRQCLGTHGAECDAKNPCNYDEHLGCLNGKCQCRNPLNEVWDAESGRCAVLVGSMCKADVPVAAAGESPAGPKCVEHAECLPEKNSSKSQQSKVGRCSCRGGFSATPSSGCLLDINQKCSRASPCNHHNALVCINGTCTCVDGSLSYDKTSKACVSLIGLPCGNLNLLDDPKELTVLCESNAVCSKLPNSPHNGHSKRFCKPSKN